MPLLSFAMDDTHSLKQPYGMPPMFPGGPQFGGPRPRQDRRNRPNNSAGGQRREEPAAFVPRVATEGSAPPALRRPSESTLAGF